MKTVEIGNHRFVITTHCVDEMYSIFIEHLIIEHFSEISCGMSKLTNLSKKKFDKINKNLDGFLHKYMEGKEVLKETSDSWKMYQGMNYQSLCDCCGRNPESVMHYINDRRQATLAVGHVITLPAR